MNTESRPYRPESLRIRAASPDDAPALAALYAQPEIARQTLGLPHVDETLWRQRIAEHNPSAGRWLLVAEHTESGQLLGQITLQRHMQARRAHAGWIALMVDAGWHGRGIGKAMLGHVLELADRWLGLRRLELEVNADNKAAIGLYQRLGFAVEGTLRGYALRDGQLIDVLGMARLHPAPAGPTPPDLQTDPRP